MFHSLSDWLSHLETKRSSKRLSERGERFDVLKEVAHQLNLLHFDCPVVTVAGTNGKGSCVALLTSIYHAAGYRVGSFTSPHLVRYNERIQINQKPIDDKSLCDAFEVIQKTAGSRFLSYFEFATLAGLWLFKKAELDVVILEVGVGGRLDVVNILDADVALITSISLDHTALLGNTVEAIALEKAGIMRSHKTCVWGDAYLPNTVRQHADQLATILLRYNRDFAIDFKAENHEGTTWTWSSPSKRLEHLPVPAITYLPNAAFAVQVVELLQESLPLNQESLRQGLKVAIVPGRFQMIENSVNTVLDVAHNPASAQLLAKNIKAKQFAGKVLMVLAMLNTKDIKGTVKPLIASVDHWYLGEFNDSSCVAAKEIGQQLQQLSVHQYDVFKSVESAYKAALKQAKSDDVIVVAGSFHTVGAVMALEGLSV